MGKIQLIESLKHHGFPKKIIDAFEKIPRENFISSNLKNLAYEDIALPIGSSGSQTTISQPYTIAEMLTLLELKTGNKVLEIGSGSGYVLALINEITKSKTYGIEIVKELAEKSRKTLKDYKDIEIYNKNGAEGLEEKSPFDRILISAAIDEIPFQLKSQLKENGILVAPIRNIYSQTLTKFRKENSILVIKDELPGFVFVGFVK